MKRETTRKLFCPLIMLIVIAIISFFGISEIAGSSKSHKSGIETLDKKKTTVLELTAASTATSAAITLIPGDVATPIAQKLADYSSYFLIILCAIFLEKYLLTLSGLITFKFLIPLACVFTAGYIVTKEETWKRFALKTALFGMVLFLLVPVSVGISNIIDDTYASSVQEAIDKAKETTNEINASTEEDKDGNIISNLFAKIKDGASGAAAKLENVLNNFLEAIAVMIITSCIIPILVFVFFTWFVKMLFGLNVNLSALPNLNKTKKKKLQIQQIEAE